MNIIELYRIIEQKERHINSLEAQNKKLIVEKIDLQEQLDLHVVGKCPNLTSVWNEAVTKQENNEHSLFVTNDCWGALETLEKHGLCKINKY